MERRFLFLYLLVGNEIGIDTLGEIGDGAQNVGQSIQVFIGKECVRESENVILTNIEPSLRVILHNIMLNWKIGKCETFSWEALSLCNCS